MENGARDNGAAVLAGQHGGRSLRRRFRARTHVLARHPHPHPDPHPHAREHAQQMPNAWFRYCTTIMGEVSRAEAGGKLRGTCPTIVTTSDGSTVTQHTNPNPATRLQHRRLPWGSSPSDSRAQQSRHSGRPRLPLVRSVPQREAPLGLELRPAQRPCPEVPGAEPSMQASLQQDQWDETAKRVSMGSFYPFPASHLPALWLSMGHLA